MRRPVPIDIGTLVTRTPGVYGGRPCLAKSGFPIIQLVADYQAGWRVADFMHHYPHISEAELYAGIAHYLANREALDAELVERNRLGRKMAERAASVQTAST